MAGTPPQADKLHRVVVLGAGGHGRAVGDLATEIGWTVVGYTDLHAGQPGIVGGDDDVPGLARTGTVDAAVVGIGNSALRRRQELFGMLEDAGLVAPPLVHPRAVLSRTCRVGDGSVIFAGCVLGASVAIGRNVVCYSGAIVEHDSRVADHCYLSPGVVLAGGVTLERAAFLGVGAVVVPGVTIGCDAVVAAGAVVIDDVPDGATVVGVPARARERQR